MSVRAAIGTMTEHRKRPPGEALVDLRRRLSLRPADRAREFTEQLRANGVPL